MNSNTEKQKNKDLKMLHRKCLNCATGKKIWFKTHETRIDFQKSASKLKKMSKIRYETEEIRLSSAKNPV